MKSNPVEQLGNMYTELWKVRDKLLQITELPTYKAILNEGERGSIDHMLKAIDLRINIIREIQIQIT